MIVPFLVNLGTTADEGPSYHSTTVNEVSDIFHLFATQQAHVRIHSVVVIIIDTVEFLYQQKLVAFTVNPNDSTYQHFRTLTSIVTFLQAIRNWFQRTEYN